MHGGAAGSGAPIANKNAFKHGLFTRAAIAERRRVRDQIRQSQALLRSLK
jgi:glucans biosynthesis protein